MGASFRLETGVVVVIVAVRAPPSISAISPKYDPAPSVATSAPSTVTFTVPSVSMKKSPPMSPSRMMVAPGANDSARAVRRTQSNSWSDKPLNSGTDRSSSMCSARSHLSPNRQATMTTTKTMAGATHEDTASAIIGTRSTRYGSNPSRPLSSQRKMPPIGSAGPGAAKIAPPASRKPE